MEIVVTPEEQARQQLTDEHLTQAVRSVNEDGYVVLADVIDHDHLDLLRERMDEDSQNPLFSYL